MNVTKPKGQVIYLGPRLHHLGLGYGTIFRDGVHPSLHAAIEVCPAIGELMIPVEQVAEVRKELAFDYAHNMKGVKGKHVTFYRQIQNWLAKQKQQQAAQQPKPSTIEVTQHA